MNKTEWAYAELSKEHGLSTYIPHLMNTLKRGKVYAWVDRGYDSMLSDDQKQVISQLEESGGRVVYAVLDYHTVVEGHAMHLESYLFVDDESAIPCVMPVGRNEFFAMSYTRNLTYGFSDLGSITIRGSLAGGPVRA